MSTGIWTWITDAERRFRRSWGRDLTTCSGRFWVHVHYQLFDHACLRIFWTNFWQVAPGVWRSNHPSDARLRRYARRLGIRTVMTLRGDDPQSYHILEEESCRRLGLNFVVVKLWARHAAKRKYIVEVIDALREAEKPLMFHCKSGADRAGFVAAMYQMVFEGVPVAEARKQLGLKYVHLDWTKTGVQDFILDVYEARLAHGEIGFEPWIRTEYHGHTIQMGWDDRQAADEVAQALIARAKFAKAKAERARAARAAAKPTEPGPPASGV